MGLVVAALLVVAACYDPSLKDCTISCASNDDCAHGQACAAGGWCAAEGASCSGVIDAPTVVTDSAPAVDAAVAPDAMTNASLRVTVQMVGQIVVEGVGTCTSTMPTAHAPATMTCTYGVVSGTELTATAMPTSSQHQFDKWTDPLCKSQGATCKFTVLPLTVIQANFK